MSYDAIQRAKESLDRIIAELYGLSPPYANLADALSPAPAPASIHAPAHVHTPALAPAHAPTPASAPAHAPAPAYKKDSPKVVAVARAIHDMFGAKVHEQMQSHMQATAQVPVAAPMQAQTPPAMQTQALAPMHEHKPYICKLDARECRGQVCMCTDGRKFVRNGRSLRVWHGNQVGSMPKTGRVCSEQKRNNGFCAIMGCEYTHVRYVDFMPQAVYERLRKLENEHTRERERSRGRKRERSSDYERPHERTRSRSRDRKR